LIALLDSDFRGSVKAVLYNHGKERLDLVAGKCYVQLVPTSYYSGHVGRFSVDELRPRVSSASKLSAIMEEGDRQAFAVTEATDAELVSVLDDFAATQRGSGGFGSTDKKRPLENRDGIT
jgi:dUTPase